MVLVYQIRLCKWKDFANFSILQKSKAFFVDFLNSLLIYNLEKRQIFLGLLVVIQKISIKIPNNKISCEDKSKINSLSLALGFHSEASINILEAWGKGFYLGIIYEIIPIHDPGHNVGKKDNSPRQKLFPSLLSGSWISFRLWCSTPLSPEHPAASRICQTIKHVRQFPLNRFNCRKAVG